MTSRIHLVNHLLALLLFVFHYAFVLNGLSLSPLVVIRDKLILRLFGALRVELEPPFGNRITQEKFFIKKRKTTKIGRFHYMIPKMGLTRSRSVTHSFVQPWTLDKNVMGAYSSKNRLYSTQIQQK